MVTAEERRYLKVTFDPPYALLAQLAAQEQLAQFLQEVEQRRLEDGRRGLE